LKILIVTALKDEALPWIEHFSLEGEYPFYEKNDVSLCIIGLGKKNIKKRLLNYFENKLDNSATVLFNLGIAGGHKSTKLGTPYFINKIHDEGTGRTYFPDCLIKHDLAEINLVTVENFVSDSSDKYKGTVDMEAAEIFRVAKKWLPLHRMVFIKIISDHMDIKDWRSLDITGLIKKNTESIIRIINKYAAGELQERSILSNAEKSFLELGSNTLKLTVSQKNLLYEMSENFKKRSQGSLQALEKFFKTNSSTVRTRNIIFMEICEYLST